MNLGRNVKVTRVQNALSTGQGTTAGTVLDMQNFDGVMFVACVGAITASGTVTVKVLQGATTSPTGELSGAALVFTGAGDDNKVGVLDVYRPTARYLRTSIVRAVQNGVVDGVVAIQYSGRKLPLADATAALAKVVSISPSEV